MENEMKNEKVVRADLGLRGHLKLPCTFMGLSMPGFKREVPVSTGSYVASHSNPARSGSESDK